ncbi:MAG: DUF2085 domain-containing protein [Thermoplasmata archaeon]
MVRHSFISKLLYSKVVFAIFILSFVWTISIFLAPATLPPGEVSDLSGFANHIDYEDLWGELPLLQGIIYYIGDFMCHQISERSFYVGSNQMPVCARDTAIFLFLTVGLFMAMLVRPSSSTSKMLVNLLPGKAREFVKSRVGELKFLVLVVFLCLIPIALDGFLQLLTDYESTNPVRFLTGSLAGWIGGFLLGAMIISTKIVTSSIRKTAAAKG